MKITKDDLDENNIYHGSNPPIQFPPMAEGQDGWEVSGAVREIQRLNVVCLADIETEELPLKVGCAEFIPDNLTIRLTIANRSEFYEVDMERDTLEDWLTHINRKRWATSEVLGDLAQVWIYHKDKVK